MSQLEVIIHNLQVLISANIDNNNNNDKEKLH